MAGYTCNSSWAANILLSLTAAPRRTLQAGLLAFSAAACAPLPAIHTYTADAPAQLPQKRSDPNVVFVTDNQKAFLFARPIIEQSLLSERTLNTAHRRAALDVFSLQLVDYVLDGPGAKAELVLHGGDLLNNSCRKEFIDGVASLRQSGRPWFVTPGNHDGYYLGISSPTSFRGEGNWIGVLNELVGWGQVCVSAGPHRKKHYGSPGAFGSKPGETDAADFQVMDKYSYVQAYIEALGVRQHCTKYPQDCPAVQRQDLLAQWPDDSRRQGQLVLRCASAGQGEKRNWSEGRLEHLREICWTELQPSGGGAPADFNRFDTAIGSDGKYKGLIEKRPWEHFVIQWLEVRIGAEKHSVVILDSASYQDTGLFTEDGGVRRWNRAGAANLAHISSLQEAILRQRWAPRMPTNQSASDARDVGRTLILGHHPLQDYDCVSRQRLLAFSAMTKARTYISGDTHDGYDVGHVDLLHGCPQQNQAPRMADAVQLREANIGAMIDAPVEYALLRGDGPSTRIDRFFLTPGDKRLHGGESRDGTYNELRRYGMPDGIWDRCLARFGGFDPYGQSHAPLSPVRVPVTQARLNQPIAYLGMPYLQVGHLFAVRDKSLEAYKINRLLDMLDMLERMLQLDAYAGLKADWPVAKVAEAREAAQNAANMGMELYYPGEGWTKAEAALNKLSKLIPDLQKQFDTYVKSAGTPEERNSRREALVCAALFEAHRESP